ncbi:hypothetical protein C5Y96_10530 [Blastopirellula marina]|uniref:DUF1559 domain-containing protein n=1 Tax=Blastopirellula marina TaxID=124 RepID=A0A2S8FMQ6_9BACT|nr:MULTISPECIES: DUF1559 domain-containing protein [Pirellulaceae]PQO33280.1 hypothetical protein C5Y96_10530 [Blastopirellula marina]RCS52369.1 DUF1559 domain-containing protein [Bremerella cremea]
MFRQQHDRLIDWIVATACLLLVVAIGAPCLVRATEQSRATVCQQHLGVIGKACLAFADAHQDSLPSNGREPHRGWNTLILPFMDQAALYDQYELSREWWDPENRPVAATQLPQLVCPSAPHGDRVVRLLDPDGKEFETAATDYVASSGAYLLTNVQERLYRGAMASPGRYYGGSKVTAGHSIKRSDITDGRANTFLVVEMADKPNEWRSGKLHAHKTDDKEHRPLVEGFSFGQWIAPNWNHLRSYDKDGRDQFGDCAVNCSNGGSIYGFHPQKANALMADGSVAALRAGLEQEVMVALVSIADGEFISAEDYQANE